MSDDSQRHPPSPPASAPEADAPLGDWFRLFTEIGILAQLSAAAFEEAMPGWLISHFSVVQHLMQRGDGVTPLALARAFQVPKTTMTHTLKTLEARGVVRLEGNPRDGRSKIVRLTDAGHAFHREALAALVPVMRDLDGADLPVGLPTEIVPILSRLREIMDGMRD